MKRIILIVLLFLSMSVDAADYMGTMQLSNGYSMEKVRVTLDKQGNVTLYRVKFAQLMPVRVDVFIPQVTCRRDGSRTLLRGDSIVPKVAEKPYPRRLITDFQGQVQGGVLVFRCKMGGREVYYRGRVETHNRQ